MFVLATLAALAGCSSTNKVTPPPTGGFSNTDLNGTYVFSTAGSDASGNFLTMLGAFSACGCTGGTISAGGSLVINDPAFVLTAPTAPVTITGGTYTVGVDGRGTATLIAATPFQTPHIVLNFVLTSTQGGLVTEFDGNGSGSGTLDLQSSVTQSDLTGTYVFNLAGVSIAALTGEGVPLATVGSVTLAASSGLATGIQDFNSNEAFTGGQVIGSPSFVLAGTSPAPGTASIGGLNFAVYPIDSTHLKFIETDPSPILVGDVFSQTSTNFPTGELAFTMAGFDYSTTLSGPLAVGGMMNSSGTAITSGVEDVNDAGASNITSTATAPLAFSGGITQPILSVGRFFVTLNSFVNGAGGTVGNYTFVAYPSTGGTQLLESDNLGVTGGVAYPQNSTSFASGQGYGLNLTGFNFDVGTEADAIAEFTNANNVLTGLIDVNNAGATNSPQNFNATYVADSSNPGRALITANSNNSPTPNLASYTVDGTNTIFIEFDPDQVAIGSIGQQAAENQGAIATRMAVLRSRTLPRGAWKKKPAAVGQAK
jgi:hypothetical protein